MFGTELLIDEFIRGDAAAKNYLAETLRTGDESSVQNALHDILKCGNVSSECKTACREMVDRRDNSAAGLQI